MPRRSKHRRADGQFELHFEAGPAGDRPGPVGTDPVSDRHGTGSPQATAAASARPSAEGLSDERLLDALNQHLFGAAVGLPFLIDIVAAIRVRGLRDATGPLSQLHRRMAKHDRAEPSRLAVETVRAIAACGDEAALKALAQSLAGDGYAAETILAGIEALTLRRASATLTLLPRWLDHAEPPVRRAACRLAGAVGAIAVVPMLVTIAGRDEPVVAAAATLALGHLGWRPAKPALEASLDRAAVFDLPDVLAALGRLADVESLPFIGRAADRADEPGRLLAVELLAGIGGPGVTAWLVRRAQDQRASVRAAVARALGQADGGDTVRAVQALTALATDPDADVRAAADEGLQALDRATAGAEDAADRGMRRPDGSPGPQATRNRSFRTPRSTRR